MEHAIEINDVWKKFKMHHDRASTLKEKVLFSNRRKYDELSVLKGINLNIEKGKTIGLIGKNGSGKSTLLKLMTRIIYPNRGSIKIEGKVSSLLELGAGFHPDFSGLENIYMNAAIFGLTKKEIDRKLDEIISFSELKDFIDSPVRTYSSGMYMRLAFSIAINVEPDILLVDEILAVGDESFQKKCFNKMKSFKSQGTTIVIVSHSLPQLEMLCDEIAWLHEGKLLRQGLPAEIVGEYREHMSVGENKRIEIENLANSKEMPEFENTNRDIFQGTEEKRNKRWGNGMVEITDVTLLDQQGIHKFTFECGEPCIIEMHYRVNQPVEDLVFGIAIFRKDNLWCYGTNTVIDRQTVNTDCLNKNINVRFHVKKLNLIEGEYYLNVAVHDKIGNSYDYQTHRLMFSTYSNIKEVGVCKLDHIWEIT